MRGDSGLSDSQFMKSQEMFQEKQEAERKRLRKIAKEWKRKQPQPAEKRGLFNRVKRWFGL